MPGPTLPPSIRDPKSGKTFVAIPAPPFIFSDTEGLSKASPEFIYVERRDLECRRLYARGHSPMIEKQSLGKWVEEIGTSGSPPDHIPWEFATCSATTSPPNETFADDTTLLNPPALIEIPGPSDVVTASASTPSLGTSDPDYVLPYFTTGSSLLRASLPSLPSTIASSISVPALADAIQKLVKNAHTSASIEKAITIPSTAAARRAFSCEPRIPCHREALVFERGISMKSTPKSKTASEQPHADVASPDVADVMSQIQELNSFFNDGMKKMETCMLQIDEGRNLLAAPSLVVSTSTATVPISLESYPELNGTVPLAVRRGKHVPAALSISKSPGPMEYPDLPSAFRGSPAADQQSFDLAYVPPSSPKGLLSTDQMIASLRAQVDGFWPQTPTQPIETASFKDAVDWLNSEIAGNNQSFSEPDTTSTSDCQEDGTKDKLSRSPSPVLLPERTTASPANAEDSKVQSFVNEVPRPTRAAASAFLSPSPHLSSFHQPEEIVPPSQNLKDWNSRLAMRKPQRKIRAPSCVGLPAANKPTPSRPSATPKKRVRFSISPPTSISQDMAEATAASEASQSTSPKAPSPLRQVYTFIAPPKAQRFSSLLNRPDAKSPAARRVSMGSAPVSTTPFKASTLPSRGISTPVSLKGRTIPPPSTNRNASLSLARGRSLTVSAGKGKENKAPRVSDLFRGTSAESTRVSAVKPRKSTLQSVLSRFKV
ncbi:hypothetical protein BD410DRAFT_129994 [Rickenella mellea]|uniref:Uncharacterized protein n=1 Tax=Rickenella mellea TaxID=50990 RepID=A0A4Y7Q8H1_9AGAM|nr:hypothetical protein BD410DRAFT_129994 [Rickenella mellea]